MLPQTRPTYVTERIGINAVATAIARIGLIWRETSTGDVGIDGQVEYVSASGHATGRLISVQVKSGLSYSSMRMSANSSSTRRTVTAATGSNIHSP
jgi:hypothetical protein